MKNKIGNPIVVGDESWAETIPEWMYRQIQSERMITGICERLNNKKLDYKESVGNCEVLVWLMTASSKAPLSAPYVKITMYLTAKVMLQTKRVKSEEELFDFLKEAYKAGLNSYEQQSLDDLKSKIYNSRGGKINHPILSFIDEIKKLNK